MELIFGVIFTIQGHWKALESKIQKIKNSLQASNYFLTKGIRPKKLIFRVFFTVFYHKMAFFHPYRAVPSVFEFFQVHL